MSDYRTILVPYDFSAHSRVALAEASELATRLDAELHLVHVIQPPTFTYGHGIYGAAAPPVNMPELREAALRALREVAQGLPGKAKTHVVEGSGIADMIHEAAKQVSADLIVMGTHGRTGLAHAFLGSVTERTLRRAPCPVLTVQAPEEDEQE